MKIWLILSLLTLSSQGIAPLTEPPQHIRKHHEKEYQELVIRFNEILSHPQNTEAVAWEWYKFTDDSGWVVSGYNWAAVKWNQGYHVSALDYFKWLKNHCDDTDGTHEPEVCRLSKQIVSENK